METAKKDGYVESNCKEYKIPLKICGDVPSHDMLSMLNSVDLLILPNQNEGLPFIAIEAIACGANAVGTCVGEIPKTMGLENIFLHGVGLVEDISDRIVYMLNNKVERTFFTCFSWTEPLRMFFM